MSRWRGGDDLVQAKTFYEDMACLLSHVGSDCTCLHHVTISTHVQLPLLNVCSACWLQEEGRVLLVSRFSGVFLLIMYIQLLIFQVRQPLTTIGRINVELYTGKIVPSNHATRTPSERLKVCIPCLRDF